MDTVTGAVRSPTENKLSNIWKDVLQLEDVKVDQDFTELDGDSLSAMLCIWRIHRDMGVELAIDEFFAQPTTIEKLAALIDERQTTKA